MGKILKYCSSCEEGFAERFTFCPDCGGSLQAVEVNPIVAEQKAEAIEPVAPVFISEEAEREVITAPFDTEPDVLADVSSPQPARELEVPSYETGPLNEPDPVPVDQEVVVVSPPTETVAIEEEKDHPVVVPVYTMPAQDADALRRPATTRADDGGYYVTVIQEDNSKQRNVLLMGATGLVLLVLASVVLIDLFTKDLAVGAVDDSPLFSAVLVDDVPMPVEELDEPEANDDEDGGGGGGGKNEQTPASKGDLPDFVRNPSRPPDVNTPRLENPSLPIPPPQLQGPPLRTPKEYGKWGLPNGIDGPPSNGPGSGGGIGSGTGTGVGSGSGTGAGSGSGSGMGSGRGDGIGDGTGSGGAPPPVIRAVTENYKILSKPKATYTDAARTNNVQGSVRLKVTLLASGQVGSITPVTRLPHGLTEQAIAAARNIRFTPKKVNGVSQSVIVTLEYGFNIY